MRDQELPSARVRLIDDFVPNAQALRERALAAPFIDWQGPDGQVYRRVQLVDIPEVRAAIKRAMGPVDVHATGFRLNFAGEQPNAAIHSDLGWGTHALVLYLCDGPGGTAFWRHRATGLTQLQVGQQREWEAVRDDWDREEAWEMLAMAPLKFGRGILYDGSQFHSRWPFAAFGSGPEDGRLIAVAFFTPQP